MIFGFRAHILPVARSTLQVRQKSMLPGTGVKSPSSSSAVQTVQETTGTYFCADRSAIRNPHSAHNISTPVFRVKCPRDQSTRTGLYAQAQCSTVQNYSTCTVLALCIFEGVTVPRVPSLLHSPKVRGPGTENFT
jgi:hypothetical protein